MSSDSIHFCRPRNQRTSIRLSSLCSLGFALMLLAQACSKTPAPPAAAPTSSPLLSSPASPASPTTQPAANDTLYQLGTIVPFTVAGPSKRFRASGWSQPEDDKTWTEGTSAVLNFSGLPSAKALTLKMTLAGLIKAPDLSAQPVEVFANGRKVAEWSVAEKNQFVVVIPKGTVSAEGTLKLEFRIPRATAPKALGQSSDPRVLGFCCFDFVIEPAS